MLSYSDPSFVERQSLVYDDQSIALISIASCSVTSRASHRGMMVNRWSGQYAFDMRMDSVDRDELSVVAPRSEGLGTPPDSHRDRVSGIFMHGM